MSMQTLNGSALYELEIFNGEIGEMDWPESLGIQWCEKDKVLDRVKVL